MTVDTRTRTARQGPSRLEPGDAPAGDPRALGPLSLQLAHLGSRPRTLIDRIRETDEEVVVLSRGRPIAVISAYRAGEPEPDDAVLRDAAAVAP